MRFLSTTFPNAPAHPSPPRPILFDQSLIGLVSKTKKENEYEDCLLSIEQTFSSI